MHLILVLLLSFQVGEAQISGRISDASGGAIPDVSIVLMNAQTHLEFHGASESDGSYAFFAVRPGDYSVKLTAPGFRPLTRDGITVPTGEHIRLDLQLQVGAPDETVTVTSDAPLLRGDSGSLGQVIDNRKVTQLPLNGRSFVALAHLSTGVALPPNSSLPRINGGRPRTNEYLYDGISVLQPEPGQVTFTPVVDSIQEFKIESNSPPAEFGRFNGGVVNLTMKSGTNEFHGNVFEFLRNEALNARNLFAPVTPANPGKPLFRRNQYGFVSGGPIKKDRTFFFVDYQGSRQNVGRVRTSTVPTLLERQGIFTERIYDPGTTRMDAAGNVVRDPFQGNVIPAKRIDPVAMDLLKRYPLPTSPGPANNFTRGGNESDNQDQGDVRLDHRLTDVDHIFARLTRAVVVQDPVAPLPDGSGSLTLGALGHTRIDSLSFASSWVHASVRTTQELRAGYSRRHSQVDTIKSPTYFISGYQQVGPSAGAFSNALTRVTELADTVSFQKGKHLLKAGGDFRWERMDIVQPPSPYGSFSFSAAQTGLPGTSASGSALASFLLGQVDKYSIDLQSKVIRPRAAIQEFFIQDDWKATDRLTLNAGVRYTLNHPSTEVDNQGAVFNLETQKLEYLGENGFPRSARQLHKLNFGPRLGLAYRASEKTVIRSGYGLIWIEQSGITTPFTTPYFPFLQTIGQRSLDNVNPAFVLSGGPNPAMLASGPDGASGQGAFAVDRGLGSGYAQQWNLSIQRELSSNILVELAYAGSQITHVGIPDTNINQLTPQQLKLGTALLQSVPNPYFGIIPQSSSLGGPLIPLAQLLKPYPRFTNISLFRNNVGNTNYNSVQAKLEKRLAAGVSLLVSYTRSKLIDEASSVFDASIITGPSANFPVADSYNRKLERDVSTGDIPNVFVTSATYDVPFAGLQLTGIVTLQSGIPLAVTQATNFNAFGGFGIQRPNRVDDPNLPRSERSTSRYFNTSAFTIAPRFTLGNSSRNPVRGPGYADADLALIKRFAFGEQCNLEIRAEVFNLTNTPPLAAPNVVLGSAGFGTITSAGDPRVIQLASKVNW